ncbi:MULTISPECIES: VOC family protein [Pseudoalteromonas]|uniref:VOC family protein n=1 Tax=Pseudoalteromonas TaxID=53246 RepID=UPI000303ADA1|nr:MULTISPECIES: VOC family protein [Pseudoalteromonas]MCO7200654.1 VOC family protein [Pseudoalteromonas sp. OANN1]MDP4487201.1 VOC family protein [Pseudoalteromonas piscicida]
MQQIKTTLLFVGQHAGNAKSAVESYIELFPRSEILDIELYGADDNEPEGAVKLLKFALKDVEFLAMDSYLHHKFGFTPAMSIYVDCESQQEIEKAYSTLAEGGKVLMPLGSYGFSQTFAWLNDRFGVSWQLNLAN